MKITNVSIVCDVCEGAIGAEIPNQFLVGSTMVYLTFNRREKDCYQHMVTSDVCLKCQAKIVEELAKRMKPYREEEKE